MDLSQYRDLFVSESNGHLQTFADLIIQLEDSGADSQIIDELFRHAHSMKGMAATMQYTQIAALAHHMEDLLGKVRSGAFPFSSTIADLLLAGCDTLTEMVSAIEQGNDVEPAAESLLLRLSNYKPSAPLAPLPGTPPETDTAQAVADTASAKPKHEFRQSDTFKTIRIRTEILDRLVNITGELITTRHHLLEKARQTGADSLNEPIKTLSALLRELRDEVFEARMLPFAFVAERFPRLVRDVARKQNKEVSLHIEGRDIELDRAILEELAEPLVHLLRNAVDHGMEIPPERAAAGKTPTGEVRITVTRDRDYVDIVISDNGRGMDPARLIDKALEKRIITEQQAAALSRQEAFLLTCIPGFSTASEITDISGRGVGMDAVKTAVNSLGGSMTIESHPGEGTSFLLRIPLTVSIIHVLMAACGPLTLAFPLGAVHRTIEIRQQQIMLENGREMLNENGVSVPLHCLRQILGIPALEQQTDYIPVVMTHLAGFKVDSFLGQHEVFVKPLGPPLSRLRGITGGAVMGDGQIVFLADVTALT